MPLVDRWIAARLDPLLARGSGLALAPNRALAARIRRYVADRGGAYDVEVATPRGLVHQLAAPEVGPIPPSAAPALARQFADRPGLFALARGHVESAAAARIAGVDLGPLPPAWQEAAAIGAGTAFERGLTRLFARAPARTGRALAGGVSFKRGAPVGFCGPQPPWVESLLLQGRAARGDV
jgi:hypothetical protein